MHDEAMTTTYAPGDRILVTWPDGEFHREFTVAAISQSGVVLYCVDRPGHVEPIWTDGRYYSVEKIISNGGKS
jgi:hypothetical protein